MMTRQNTYHRNSLQRNSKRRNTGSAGEGEQGITNLEKHVKIKSEAIREQVDEVRKRLHGTDLKNAPESDNDFERGLLDSKIKASET